AHAEHGVQVSGLASPPDLTRGGRDDIVLVVNGRPVRDPGLLQATLDAYRPLLPRDRFPLVVLAIALPEADVDVNVHPTKAWVRFERLRRELERGAPASQALLFPEPVDLGPAGRALLERWRAPLERLGFAFEGFGGDAVVVSAVPALLKGDEPKRLIQAAVEELGGPKAGEPAVDRALAFVACRAAVKANMPLAREEMERLVAELGATETPYF